ncbi:hypothetical protein MD484_g8639, partial [Candolleomyces efflorescens]
MHSLGAQKESGKPNAQTQDQRSTETTVLAPIMVGSTSPLDSEAEPKRATDSDRDEEFGGLPSESVRRPREEVQDRISPKTTVSAPVMEGSTRPLDEEDDGAGAALTKHLNSFTSSSSSGLLNNSSTGEPDLSTTPPPPLPDLSGSFNASSRGGSSSPFQFHQQRAGSAYGPSAAGAGAGGVGTRATSSSTASSTTAPLTPSTATFGAMNRTNSRTSKRGADEYTINDDDVDVGLGASRVDFVNQTLGGPSMDGVLATPAVSHSGSGSGGAGGAGGARTGRTRSGTLTAGSTGASTSNGASTNANANATTTTAGSKVSKLTLRDQEKHIDNLKKENFSIKLRVHFLEDQLARLAPDQMEAALKQNINLKIEVQQRGMEIKKLKKLVLSLEHELERLQRVGAASSSTGGGSGGGTTSQRERELEEKLAQRDLEIRELRRRLEGTTDDEELLLEKDALLREAESRNAELEDELDSVRGLLEENMDEMQRLQGIIDSQRSSSRISSSARAREDDTSTSSVSATSSNRDPQSRSALHQKLDALTTQLTTSQTLITRLEDENADLVDTVASLELELEQLHDKYTRQEHAERSASRAMIIEEQEARDTLQSEVDGLRDRVAALLIELSTCQDESEAKSRELDELVAEHDRIVDSLEREFRSELDRVQAEWKEDVGRVESEWREEVDETRSQMDELRDVLGERDSECRELRLSLTELEDRTEEMHSKFNSALAQLEDEVADLNGTIQSLNRELEEKDEVLSRREVEVERAREEVDMLGERVVELEEEVERVREEGDRTRDEDEAQIELLEREREEWEVERVRNEGVVVGLKDKNTALKSELEDLQDILDESHQTIRDLSSKRDELASHIERLVVELESTQTTLTSTRADFESRTREYESQIRTLTRSLEVSEGEVGKLREEVERRERRVREREDDLENLKRALEDVEHERKQLGESVTSEKYGLQLEVDRLSRDLDRAEDELTRLRAELASRESTLRSKEGNLDTLHAQILDLKSSLSLQTQARLNLSTKLDDSLQTLRLRESELSQTKVRIGQLEERLGKDQRALLSAEGVYRDQVTERNTLLLTVYQYLERVVGVEKVKKGQQAETKPFTNFSVFHDNLVTRLKMLSSIQTMFETRAKDLEGKYGEKVGELKRQLESRWRQLDKFEASLKQLGDVKRDWRRKLREKEGEVEGLKATNTDISSQLSILKRNPATSQASLEIKSLQTRALNAERRYNNAQNQLIAAEERNAQIKEKTASADEKWEARVREYEARIKASEERVKRERQGAKERVQELEGAVR